MGKKVVKRLKDVEEFLEGILTQLSDLSTQMDKLEDQRWALQNTIEEKINELTVARDDEENK